LFGVWLNRIDSWMKHSDSYANQANADAPTWIWRWTSGTGRSHGDDSSAPTCGEVFTGVVDNYLFLGLVIPDQVLEELQALRVWSDEPQFRVVEDLISWRPAVRPRAAAMTTQEGRLNPTAAAGFIYRILSDRLMVRRDGADADAPDGPWSEAHDRLLKQAVADAPWLAPWSEVAVILLPHLPAACRARWVRLSVVDVEPWTPI
jgi:hypothetical protein